MSADIYTNKITHTVTAKTHSKLARFVTYAYDKIDHFQFVYSVVIKTHRNH